MNSIEDIAIKINKLSKVYKKSINGEAEDFYALKDLNFEIKKGEVLGVIGKNGSGKSTLLKILSGITKPSSGSIEINGSINSILDVGTGFHPDLSGRENVYLRGEFLGMKHHEIDALFTEILNFSEIGDFIDTPIKNYSSGMFLRLAFAVVIHLKAAIIILDEVISVGDVNFQIKCFEKIKELVKTEKATIIIVSHDVARLNTLISKLILLQNGEIQKFASNDEAFNHYISSNIIIQKSPIEQVSLSDKDGKKRKEFYNTEAINICIKGLQLNDQTSFFSMRFKDVFGNVVFITSPFFRKKGSISPIVKSSSLSFTIPGYYFNKGILYIDLIYSDSEKILNTVKNITHFSIELDEAFKNIKLYGESGALKPYFEWKEG